MKKFTIFLILFLSACTANKTILFDGMATYRTNRSWKQDFKDRVLCNCIVKGIGIKSVTDSIRMIDRSFSNEIELVFRNEITSVLKPIISKMRQDSLESLTTMAEGARGKHVFNTCIYFYKSKKLDSISKVMLRRWNKMPEDSVLGCVLKGQLS